MKINIDHSCDMCPDRHGITNEGNMINMLRDFFIEHTEQSKNPRNSLNEVIEWSKSDIPKLTSLTDKEIEIVVKRILYRLACVLVKDKLIEG